MRLCSERTPTVMHEEPTNFHHARRKVFDQDDFMIIAQKRLDEKHEIKPFVGGITQQPVIKVAAVNIDYRSLLVYRKCKGLGFPKPRAASPKVGGLT